MNWRKLTDENLAEAYFEQIEAARHEHVDYAMATGNGLARVTALMKSRAATLNAEHLRKLARKRGILLGAR